MNRRDIPRNLTAATLLTCSVAVSIQVPTSAHAQGLDAAFEECASIADGNVRLACFDALSRSTLTTGKAAGAAETRSDSGFGLKGNGTDEAATRPQPSASTAPEDARERFGKQSDTGPDQITVLVTSAKKSPLGGWIITTRNGQIWRQSDQKRLAIRELPAEAIIKKAALGSFMMKINGSRTTFRVRRKK